MDDLGFNGTGSRFNTRFGSDSVILGKQLNDMGTGLQAGLPMPNISAGPAISFTAGGVTVVGETDPNLFGRYQYNADPPQFKCVVYVDPNQGAELKYYLKIARGVITATGTRFPLTQGTIGNGGGALLDTGWIIPCQERMIFDVAISPIGSRTAGPQSQSQSAWMASDGKFELDPEVGHYYVTASFLDYDDGTQNWYPDETLISNHEPWVSIVASTGESKDNIFTLNTPTGILYKVCLGIPGAGDSRGSMGNYPLWLGYGMKVIARIDWKSDLGMWEVRQEMLGPITIDIPFTCTVVADSVEYPGSGGSNTYYQQQYQAKFASDIVNYNYIEKFKDTGYSDSDILATEWWYDPKDI